MDDVKLYPYAFQVTLLRHNSLLRDRDIYKFFSDHKLERDIDYEYSLDSTYDYYIFDSKPLAIMFKLMFGGSTIDID